MSCALCSEAKPLQQSHLIPEFLYKPLYDPKHRLLETLVKVDTSGRPIREHGIKQKGYREPLLCSSCEGKLGRWEAYAAAVFPRDAVTSPNAFPDCIRLRGLDYKPLKLFLLSLIWRCGAGSGPFSTTDLGPHQERLRGMLLAEAAGTPLTYPCVVMAVTVPGKHFRGLVVPPRRARVEGHHIWTLIGGGYVFSYYISSHPPPATLNEVILSADGDMTIVFQDIAGIPHVHDGIKSVFALRKPK